MNILIRYLTESVERTWQRAARAMPGPILVRLVVWAACLVALAYAYPSGMVTAPGGAVTIAMAALLPALFPRTAVVTVLAAGAVFGWFVDTAVYEAPVTILRLLAIAAGLYVMHSGAALAAVLPYDTVVSPGVLLRWGLRALGVVAATAVFGVLAFAGADLAGDRSHLVATFAGILVAGALTWVLVRKA